MTLARDFIFPPSLPEAFLENRTQGNECNDYKAMNALSPVGAPSWSHDSRVNQGDKE
jgi:hypothetical protein